MMAAVINWSGILAGVGIPVLALLVGGLFLKAMNQLEDWSCGDGD